MTDAVTLFIRMDRTETRRARELEQQKKEEEKARIEAVKAKQANKFGSFFKPKPKATALASEKSNAVPSPSEPAILASGVPATIADGSEREATPEMSEFHQVFKPHAVRPGTRWAVVNQWTQAKMSGTGITKDIGQCTSNGA